MKDTYNISKVCRILSNVIFVLGLISSFYIADIFGKSVEHRLYQFSYDRDWSLTILYFIIGCFSTTLLGMVFLGMAEIMDRIEEVKIRLENIEIKLSDKDEASSTNRVEVQKVAAEEAVKPVKEMLLNEVKPKVLEMPTSTPFVTPSAQTDQPVKRVDKYGDEEIYQEEQSDFIRAIKKYQMPLIVIVCVIFVIYFIYFYLTYIA